MKKENIKLIINNIEDILNLLVYNNEVNDNKKDDETLSNFFQIIIIKNLLKDLEENISKMEINELKDFRLESDKLLSNEKLKPNLLKIKLLFILLKDDELFCDKINYKIYYERFLKLKVIFNNLIKEQDKKVFSKWIKK